ncbi:MAG: ATP-dependent helicase, partial [Methanosarcinales archaeon]
MNTTTFIPNPAQREAIEYSEGPLLIVAGAGTGKTECLTQKIMHLVNKENLKPSEILGLTFSEKAAEEMLNRVSENFKNSSDFQISTFHSFCAQLLRDYAMEIGIDPNFKIIDEYEKIALMLKQFDDYGIKHFEVGNNTLSLVKALAKVISRAQDEYVSVETYYDYVAKKEKELSKKLNKFDEVSYKAIARQKEVARVYRLYQEEKLKNGMLDFGDLIAYTIKLLEDNPYILAKCQERYKYILVDEFQDTNYAQTVLINLLAKKHKNIGVVGDDDQSIYRFRGAYLTNIKEFKENYPDSKIVIMEQNYRSTKNILDASNKVIKNNCPNREDKELYTKNPKGAKIKVLCAENPELEADEVVRIIKQKVVEEQRKYSDFAILLRSVASHAQPFINALKRSGMPYEVFGERSFFQRNEIKDIIAYLKVIDHPIENVVSLMRLLTCNANKVNEIELAKITQYADKNKLSAIEVMDRIYSLDLDLSLTTKSILYQFIANLKKLINLKHTSKLSELVYFVIYSNRYLNRLLLDGKLENLQKIANLNQLYDLSYEFEKRNANATLHEFLDYLDLAEKIGMDEASIEDGGNTIKVITVHRAKGKEYPVVFVSNLVQGRFPSKNRKDLIELPDELCKGEIPNSDLHLEDERRLMYVAMTRSKEELFLTIFKKHSFKASKPSVFLEELEYKENPIVELKDIESKVPIESSIFERLQIRYKKKVMDLLYKDAQPLEIFKYLNLLEKIKGYEKGLPITGESIKKSIVDYWSEIDDKTLEEETLQCIKTNTITMEKEKNLVQLPPYVSYSQINTYLNCPRQYKYKYVFKIPTPAKSYFSFGKVIHETLEKFHKKFKDTSIASKEDILSLYKESWNREGYENKTQELEHLQDGEKMLIDYLEIEKENASNIKELEKKFYVKVDDLVIHGYIDRIDELPEGGLEIIDYKTSRSPKSENALKKDLQLPIYAIATQQIYNKYPEKLSIYWLRHGKKTSVSF